VRPHPLNKHDCGLISDLRHQPVTVSLHIKNYAIVLQKICGSISVLYVLWGFPLGMLHFGHPRLHRFASLSVPLDERVDLVLTDQYHLADCLDGKASAETILPIWEYCNINFPIWEKQLISSTICLVSGVFSPASSPISKPLSCGIVACPEKQEGMIIAARAMQVLANFIWVRAGSVARPLAKNSEFGV